ncbi:Filamentous haemagglutinin-like [Rivularia sp. IAM M-261]|nr:Filamentous haemagglutinin-like [Rivularia sp. IAM M-261]
MLHPWYYYKLDCARTIFIATVLHICILSNTCVAQITPDNTLPIDTRVLNQGETKVIEGGTQAGKNLFHSFEEFSVLGGQTAYFNNSVNIQNIITRVTGKSSSNIDGTLRSNGAANLFLINPNGITFGASASLDIGGSFVGTTASSIKFEDGSKYSAVEPQTPLLTISTPIGLQFGANPAPIRNQSQASPNGATNYYNSPEGLRVSPGKTLALIGGDIYLESGSLTAPLGQIELGSVGSNSFVNLIPTSGDWIFEYKDVKNFKNIQITSKNLSNSSNITTSGQSGSGNIHVIGNIIEIFGVSGILNLTLGDIDAGDIVIDANKLTLQDGAQILAGTVGKGTGGNLTINASNVDVLGGSYTEFDFFAISAIGSTTYKDGNAGNVNINTKTLRVKDGGNIVVESSGINTPESLFKDVLPATGNAGNLTINATQLVEIIGKSPETNSNLSATTLGSGNAGKLTVNTGKLIVNNGGEIKVGSRVITNSIGKYLGDRFNLGRAGNLDITANSILIDNQGKITSETDLGQGGNITLQTQLLQMRRNSLISTSAGKIQSSGDGGNIIINARNGFIVAARNQNNDIIANGFSGSGGKITINASGILGIEALNREDLIRKIGSNDPSQIDPQKLSTSDISAISQTNANLDGVVSITNPDVDSSSGLVNLPEKPNVPTITQACKADNTRQNKFSIVGRRGLATNPTEFLRNTTIPDTDWISVENSTMQYPFQQSQTTTYNNINSVIEAQAWKVDKDGTIILTSTAPKIIPHSKPFVAPAC